MIGSPSSSSTIPPHGKNWDNHVPECIHHLSTPLHHLVIWLVESSTARIWRHHCPGMVEFVNAGMFLDKGDYTFHQLLNHTMIDGMKNFRYANNGWGNAFCIPEDTFWGCNRLIFQQLSWFPSLCLSSVSSEYHLLEVLPIVAHLLWQWIHVSKRPVLYFTHQAMGLLDRVKVNGFEVVIRPCKDGRISLPHPTIHSKQKVSSVQNRVEITNEKVEDILWNLSIVDFLFLFHRCVSMSLKAIFWRNQTKGNKGCLQDEVDFIELWRKCFGHSSTQAIPSCRLISVYDVSGLNCKITGQS